MSGRILAGAVLVALVFVALVTESGNDKLSPERAAAQIARDYGSGAKASCEKWSGRWDYKCRVRTANLREALTVDVRVDKSRIVEMSDR